MRTGRTPNDSPAIRRSTRIRGVVTTALIVGAAALVVLLARPAHARRHAVTRPVHDVSHPLFGYDVFQKFLPDYAALGYVEDWRWVGSIDRGPIEVAPYRDHTYLFAGLDRYEFDDGMTWNPATRKTMVDVPPDSAYFYGNSWVATAPDGSLDVFLQAQERHPAPGTTPKMYIARITSKDGTTFTAPEKVLDGLLDIGSDVSQCAHGRVTKLANGTYLMAFSATVQRGNWPAGELGPTYDPGTMLAYSENLEHWDVRPDVYFPACHDPTFLQDDAGVHLYCTSEPADALLRYDSPDGITWTPSLPAGKVAFHDSGGEVMSRATYNVRDTDTNRFPDGTVRFYVGVTTPQGHEDQVWIFEKTGAM